MWNVIESHYQILSTRKEEWFNFLYKTRDENCNNSKREKITLLNDRNDAKQIISVCFVKPANQKASSFLSTAFEKTCWN